jgi:LysR family hydrogen peroxide-inducible transcriptional activator
MNLRDLRYLVTVADLKNFSQAAEACFVSQPTLSMQIKKLEDELGVTLFERSNRSVRLTEPGERILEASRRILGEVDLIKTIAGSSRDPLAGSFRLGAFPTLASYVFPRLVPEISRGLPKLKLLLVEEKTDVLVERLKAGQCDAALLALPVNDPPLVAMKIFEDPFLLALPASHPWADHAQIDPAELRQVKLLLLDEGHCLRDQALDVCYQHGGHEEADFRATSLETLRMMVKAGSGLTLMPRIAARLDDPEIRYLPFSEPAPRRIIGLVWRKTSARQILTDRIVEMARGALSQL